MPKIFENTKKHLSQQDETYLKHMLMAIFCSLKLILASFACLIHAFFPFLFIETATKTAVEILNKRGKAGVING